MSYDTIIVGAGAAGAVLAARLSEDSAHGVLLLEAGPDFAAKDDLPEEIRYAYGRPRNLWARAFGSITKYGWNYTAVRTPVADSMLVQRGKIVGGSSAINAMIFLRGVPEDYDSWAKDGNDCWRFEQLLSYFCKNERDLDFGHMDYHGDSGPIPAQRFSEGDRTADQAAFYSACCDAGYPACPDHNAPNSSGVGPLAHNSVDGIRWSTNLGYLAPARRRPNLTVQGETLVHRVLFEGRRATGVLAERDGDLTEIRGNEILLCAGAIASPALLLRSGLGPATGLRALDIDIIQEMGGVGHNLRDHPQIPILVRTRPEIKHEWGPPQLNLALRYTATGSPWRNDMIIIPVTNAVEDGVTNDEPPVGFYVVPCIYLAESAGSLHLVSKDPHVQPALDYNYLAQSFDRTRLREGVRIVLDLLQHSAYESLIAEVVNLRDDDLVSDAALDGWMLRHVSTSHHSASTCKMGPSTDPHAVVDQFGRVHGIDGLRVVDASIMPDCVRANTNVTSMVIGERIADLIKLGH